MSEKRVNVFSHFYKVCSDVAQIATTKIVFNCNGDAAICEAIGWDFFRLNSKPATQIHSRQLAN